MIIIVLKIKNDILNIQLNQEATHFFKKTLKRNNTDTFMQNIVGQNGVYI